MQSDDKKKYLGSWQPKGENVDAVYTCSTCSMYCIVSSGIYSGTKSLMEQLEGQFLINEWTPAFLTDFHLPKETTPLGICNQEEPPSKKQKTTGKGKEKQKKAEKNGKKERNWHGYFHTCIMLVYSMAHAFLYTQVQFCTSLPIPLLTRPTLSQPLLTKPNKINCTAVPTSTVMPLLS